MANRATDILSLMYSRMNSWFFPFKPASFIVLLTSVHEISFPGNQAQLSCILLPVSHLSGNPAGSSRLYTVSDSPFPLSWPLPAQAHTSLCSLLTSVLPPWPIYSLLSTEQIDKCNPVPILDPVTWSFTLSHIHLTPATLSSLLFLRLLKHTVVLRLLHCLFPL